MKHLWRLPGWQSQYVAGGLAAAMVHTEGADVSILMFPWLGLYSLPPNCVTAMLCIGEAPERRSAHIRQRLSSGAIKCKDGHFAPGSIRPIDWETMPLLRFTRMDRGPGTQK